MDFNRIKFLVNTVKYLKWKQIFYRVFYALKKRFIKKEYAKEYKGEIVPLEWSCTIKKQSSYLGEFNFSFLNIEHTFEGSIDWNYDEYGKLWTYNLNYFDYLNQVSISKSQALILIKNFIARTNELKDGLEPYPISLRCINWVKYICKENIQDKVINKSLYNQYLRLLDSIEYHLLGNHLLENGLSLIFGAYYFKDDTMYAKAKNIIENEIKEQITSDGAHFELSPMYHQIILERILDCISLLEKNRWNKDSDLLSLMKYYATKMLSWLNEITFRDNSIPMVNDSAYGIAPNTLSLVNYAKNLKIFPVKVHLSDSGYRKFTSDSYELFVDVGEVGPKYQPGHAHADTLSFILHIDKPLIIDTGLSTYNMGKVREDERSTIYHNTVTINKENSSQVWAGFRVANRANVKIEKDEKNKLIASHNGYKNQGVKHTRIFTSNKSEILISDIINKDIEAQAHLHFYPGSKLQINVLKNEVKVDNILISFDKVSRLQKKSYGFSNGFNKKLPADKITVTFRNSLKTKIKIIS